MKIIGINVSFAICIVLGKDLVNVCPGGIPYAHGPSDPFDLGHVNLTLQGVGISVDRTGSLLPLSAKESFLDIRVNSYNSSFSCCHICHVSLPCIESQSSSVFGSVSMVHLVGPFQLLELRNLLWSDEHWCSNLLPCSRVGLFGLFVTGIPVLIVSILGVAPSSRDCNLFSEPNLRRHPSVVLLGHSTKVAEFEAWLVVVYLLQIAFSSEVQVGQARLMGSFSSNVHFNLNFIF